jgi:hypothetical protein
MMGYYETLRDEVYSGQLEETELRPQLLREKARVEEIISQERERLTDIEMDKMSALLSRQNEIRAQAGALRRAIIAREGNFDTNMLQGWVRQQNNIRDAHVNLETRINQGAQPVLKAAISAASLQPDSTTAAIAGWETLLGTRLEAGTFFESDPGLAAVKEVAEQQFGTFEQAVADGFIADEITKANYQKLKTGAEQKKNNLVKTREHIENDATLLEGMQRALQGENTGEASRIFTEYAATKDLDLNLFDSDDVNNRVAEAMERDPEILKLKEQSDYLWKAITGDKRDDTKRAAYARLLSKPKFQEWAKKNEFVVGDAEVDELGNVVSFRPGKDLMAAYTVSRKQMAKRPTAGAEGPLIARKGARDLVRVVKNNGEVVLGKTLPPQAADDAGSVRIATGGGEVYLRKEEVKSSDVVKTRRKTPGKAIGEAVKTTRGELAQRRAQRAYESLMQAQQSPAAPDPEPAPAPEPAPPPEPAPAPEPEAAPEPPKKTKREERKDDLLNPQAATSDVPSAKDIRRGTRELERIKRRGRKSLRKAAGK